MAATADRPQETKTSSNSDSFADIQTRFGVSDVSKSTSSVSLISPEPLDRFKWNSQKVIIDLIIYKI